MTSDDDHAVWAELENVTARERREYEERTRRRDGASGGRPVGLRRNHSPSATGGGGRRLSRGLGEVSAGIKNMLKMDAGGTANHNKQQQQQPGLSYELPPAETGGLLMGFEDSAEMVEEEEDAHYRLLTPDDDWGAVPDLDAFFTDMYRFYHGRGLPTIIARGVASLAILGFTVAFSTFLLAFVDWPRLLSCHDEASCLDFSEYVSARALRAPHPAHLLVLAYCALFVLYWLWCLAGLWATVRDARVMYRVYTQRLGIGTRELQTMPWNEVVRRFLVLHKSGRYRVAIHKRDLTAHDIASRIMRKDNYLIALINKEVVSLHLPLPFFGAIGRGTAGAHTRRQFLTRSLEWSLHLCVLGHIFGRKFTVRPGFLRDVRALRWRFVAVGLAQLALLPFLLLFMVMYFFLQNAQEWHSSKNYLGPREWGPLARWTFREFNELQHIFERRMEGSYQHANDYLGQFPKPVLSSVMRIVRFLSGSFVAVLLLLTLLDESILLYVKLYDRNLLWFVGVFSAVYAFSRGLAPQASDVVTVTGADIEETMLRVAAHTHYLPERWRGRTHTDTVRDEVMTMFQYKAQLFLQELLSVLFAPVVLCVSLPGCAQQIVDFIAEHTVDVDGIGSVCSFSLFDFGRYGDEDYASPDPTAAAMAAAAVAAAANASAVSSGSGAASSGIGGSDDGAAGGGAAAAVEAAAAAAVTATMDEAAAIGSVAGAAAAAAALGIAVDGGSGGGSGSGGGGNASGSRSGSGIGGSGISGSGISGSGVRSGGGGSGVRSGGGGMGGGGGGAGRLSPSTRGTRDVTENGKMEKSFLNFKANYPEWECGEAGQLLLARLATFQQAYVQQQHLAASFMHVSDDMPNPEDGNARSAGGAPPLPAPLAAVHRLAQSALQSPGSPIPPPMVMPPPMAMLPPTAMPPPASMPPPAPRPPVLPPAAAAGGGSAGLGMGSPSGFGGGGIHQGSVLGPSGLGAGMGRSLNLHMGASLSPSMVPSLQFSQLPSSVMGSSHLYASRLGGGGGTMGGGGGMMGGGGGGGSIMAGAGGACVYGPVEYPPEGNSFYWLEKFYAAHRQGVLPGILDLGSSAGGSTMDGGGGRVAASGGGGYTGSSIAGGVSVAGDGGGDSRNATGVAAGGGSGGGGGASVRHVWGAPTVGVAGGGGNGDGGARGRGVGGGDAGGARGRHVDESKARGFEDEV